MASATEQSSELRQVRDSGSRATRTIQKEGVPASKAAIAIPVDSLLKLPSAAVYTKHSGQATATVGRKGDVVYVTATCDSLAREAEYYEELYYRARDALEAYELERSEEREKSGESKEPLANPIVIFMIGITAGALGTIAIIIHKKEKRV